MKRFGIILASLVILGGGYFAYQNLSTDTNTISVQIKATPNKIKNGETTTVSWSSVGATRCVLSSGANSSVGREISTSGSEKTGSIEQGDLPITITCYDALNSVATAGLDLTIETSQNQSSPTSGVKGPDGLSVQIKAVPNEVYEGERTTLSWSSIGADTCLLRVPNQENRTIEKNGSLVINNTLKEYSSENQGRTSLMIFCFDIKGESVSSSVDLTVKTK